MEDVGIFVLFYSIWNILWPFGIFYGYMAYFPRYGMFCPEKSGNPGCHAQSPLHRFSPIAIMLFFLSNCS
jgi:hypothetical protein